MGFEQEIINAKHPVLTDGIGSIHIEGFHGLQADKCFCVMQKDPDITNTELRPAAFSFASGRNRSITVTSSWSMKMESSPFTST